jgi:hypothetical protein
LKYGDDAPLPDPYQLPAGAPPTPPADPPHPAGAPSPGATPSSGYQSAAFVAVPVSPYATWALVIGVFGLICFGAGPVLGMIAVVLGVLGWRQVTRAGGGIRGKFSAAAGMLTGVLAIVFFAGEVALYLTLVRPQRVAAGSSAKQQDPMAALSSSADDDPSNTGNPPGEPPSGASAVTTVGHITVVDVALGVASLSNELRRQHAEATANGEKLLLETTATSCPQCQGIASSLPDPRMQNALDHVRLVRVDRDPFEEDLAELEIPSRPLPGFFLLDSDLRVTDAIHGGEWDEDIAVNIAPVLGPFVRGTYAKRRSPWKKLPRPGGTVL